MPRRCDGLYTLIFKEAMKQVILLLALLMPCFSVGVFAEEQPKLKVMATFSILGDLVQNVGGSAIDLDVLVGAGGDAHAFEPTPQDGIRLSKANIIFENGLSFEHWLSDLYEASQAKASRVAVTAGVGELRQMDDQGEDIDPHLWHNVNHVMVMVAHIKEALISIDPRNKDLYEQNAVAYLEELQGLEDWIRTQVQGLPQEHRQLVTSHDTFAYFADHYGFKIVGTAIASATTEAAEPSAKQMAILINQIKQAGVRVIFTESISNPRLMQMLAQEAKVKVAPALYTDALGEKGSNGDSYIKMMQYNVTTIVEGLRQK